MLIIRRAYISCLDIGGVFEGIGVLCCLADILGCVRDGAVGGYVVFGEDRAAAVFVDQDFLLTHVGPNFAVGFLDAIAEFWGCGRLHTFPSFSSRLDLF